MTFTPKNALKTCFAAGAMLAVSGCNTMTSEPGMAGMNHSGMKNMRGAMLTGAAEAPAPGDMNGRGHFHYTLNRDSNQLCYKMMVQGIAAPTAAHIHEAAIGVAGGVVATLQTPMIGRETDTCMTIEPALASRLMASPANFYVNVHNSAYPNGAVRGQLMAMMPQM